VEDYLPKREEGTIFPLPQLIVELIVTDADKNKFEKALESGSAVFEKSDDHEKSFLQLGLNEDAEAVMAQVDGQRSASEVASASGQDAFNSFKLLHALALLGILKRKSLAAPVPVSVDSFEAAGVADASEAWTGEMPKFDLDDAPALTVAPLPGLPDVADIGALPEPKMPAWEPPSASAPPQPIIPEPEPEAAPGIDPAPEENQWGFDEAQIETARKATIPPPVIPAAPPAPPPRRTMSGTSIGSSTATMRKSARQAPPPRRSRFGLIMAIMVVFIVAAGGWFGFTWWQGRETGTAVAQPVVRPKPAPPPVTRTTVSVAPVTQTTATITPPRPVTKTTTTATTTATMAPAPPRPRPAPATADSSRYEAMAREFAATATGSFTVQFAIVCEPSNVTKALNNGGTNVWFVPISIKGRACYRMYWGRFGTRDEAERGMASLPAALRESKPAVVPITR
ncbi:MAG: hypothetical protein ACREF4_19220, partial [Gammaproteobacteria bacterium]